MELGVVHTAFVLKHSAYPGHVCPSSSGVHLFPDTWLFGTAVILAGTVSVFN